MSGAKEPLHHSRLARHERAILEMSDNGVAVDQIVAVTGYAKSTVQSCVAMFSISDAAHRQHQNAAAKGSAELLSAITALNCRRIS